MHQELEAPTGISRRQMFGRGSAIAGTAMAGSLLAACGGGDDASEATTPSSSEAAGAVPKRQLNKTVELTYWTWAWPPPGGGAEELVAAFEKAEPRVKLSVKQYPYPDYVTALKTGVPNKTAGGVLALETGSMLRQYAAFLEPLEERVKEEWGPDWETAFLPTSVTEIRESVPDGRTLYAIPQQFSVGGIMWYSKSLFAEVGARVPKSYDELKEVCAKLTAKGIIPIAWGAKDQWPNTDYLISFAGMWKPGVVDAAERGEVEFTDPAIVGALSFMGRSMSDGIWNKAPFATTAFPEAYGSFTGGKAAMTSNGTWGLNLFKPGQFKDLGVFLWPHIEGAPETGRLGSTRSGVPADAGPNGALPWKTDNVTLAVRAGQSADEAEAAFRFVKYFTGPEGQKVGASTFTPARKDTPNPLVTPAFQDAYDWQNSLAGVAERRQFQYPETRTAVQDAIAEVCVNGANAEEALSQVQTTVERARRRAEA